MGYNITSGVISSPVKTVIYGPEGIGKSTFAAQFPDPVFIDTEGSTDRINVQRLPKPSSWAMLLDECNEVRKGNIPCGTLVIDTADWAERLGIESICTRAKVDGIEGFGYGKGYMYIKEEFGKLLDILEDVKNAGHNVTVTAHAQITKFEQPDEMGSYDRWSMKTTKYVAPLLREWCDLLLFANYKTFTVKSGDGKMAKNKAQGGRERVIYTTHHACWDAKNRFSLPDEIPFDYSAIAPHIWTPTSAQQSIAQQPSAAAQAPKADPLDTIIDVAKDAGIPVQINNDCTSWKRSLMENGVPEQLADLMASEHVSEKELQKVVGERGYFPEDMPIEDYPADFVSGCLVAAWPNVLQMIMSNRDLPF